MIPNRDRSRFHLDVSRRRVLLALAYYEHRMHRGVADYAQQANWILDSTMAHYRTPPRYWQGEGVLTLALPDQPDLIRYLRRLDLPIVALTTDVKEIAAARVVLDNFEIGRIAAKHLLERGFKHLGFYRCTDYDDVCQRQAGFVSAVEDAGLDYVLLDWHATAKKNLRANPFLWLKRRLRALPKPLGIAAQSDHRAYFLLCVCEHAGIRVPEEVAVVGVDNDQYTCDFAPVPITSVDSNRERLAYAGAALLDSLIDGRPSPAEPVVVPPVGLVVRRSTDILAVEHPEVARALGFIWRHFNQRIGVNDVVAATTMSRCGLYQAFQEYLGRTIREEIERKRLELARQLLTTSTAKIARIAGLAGFSSGEQFCRAFTRSVGVAPSVFRDRQRGR